MDRRMAIADAAIEVLASEGSRGLSHRAVDRRLGIAPGSVSYYFRSRQALIDAAASRLVQLDEADVDRTTPDLDGVCALVDDWLAPPNRARLIARFELFLMAARATDAGPLASARSTMIDSLAARLDEATPYGDVAAAVNLIALIEGLLLDAMMGSPLGSRERRQIFSRALTS